MFFCWLVVFCWGGLRVSLKVDMFSVVLIFFFLAAILLCFVYNFINGLALGENRPQYPFLSRASSLKVSHKSISKWISAISASPHMKDVPIP